MNAKELILKKINADTNWVDIYTVSFMLGEPLESVGNLMLDPDITELVNNYSSSIFSDTQNSNKIKYVQSVIVNTNDSVKIKKYTELLNKVIAAEELRILGKILKINQGLPTNTVELYTYIKSIEKYVESRYNRELIEPVQEILVEINKADQSGNSRKLRTLISTYKDLKSKMENNWISFDLMQFINDPEYRQTAIDSYESNKVNFNILEVISSVPHFKEMFNVLSINKQVLNMLSVRNKIEDIIWNQSLHYPKLKNGNRSENGTKTAALDKAELYELKDSIDQHIINSWIISRGISVNMIPNKNRPVIQKLHLDGLDNTNKFRSYIELDVIPLLKEKLPNNKFISLLTLGVKGDTIFYKLPFNMTQIDNNAKTKSLYEQALADFNNLNNYEISELGINLVDLFYLYNLIVNKDKFGPTSLTRIFEDLVSSAQGDKLLLNDFNNWIDKQDPNELVKLYYSQSITRDFNHVDSIEEAIIVEENINKDDSSIGFKENNNIEIEEPINNSIEESKQSSIVTSQYNTQPSTESKLITLVKTANIPGLHLVYDKDLVNEEPNIRNAKGFIRNGEIYINADRATDDTVIHEFGHLYLADAKLQHLEEYYQLLSKVKETDTWKRMRQMSEYDNKRGSDFDEEVLATILSYPFTSNELEDSIVKEAMNLISPEYKELINSSILPVFTDTFISENYKEQQRLATIKNRLIKDNTIKEDCK